MLLETVESRGLAQLSYLVGDDDAGVAAVIDPRRDVETYLQIAQRANVRIAHIVETHIQADYVSGSRELSALTGAPIHVGAAEGYGFEHITTREGDTIELGSLRLRALHTPGHTPEHMAWVVEGGKGAGAPWGVFTGDALFAGEVGRPDLLGEGTEEPLARQLYHSLHDKLLRLGDGVVVYPCHGEGSPCGASIGDRKATTIGYERAQSCILQVKSEDEFVRQVLASLPPAPSYYPRLKQVNLRGPRVLGHPPVVPAFPAQQFAAQMQTPGTLVVDTREIEAFGGGHIEGALSIPYRPDEFAVWAGWMLKPEQRLLLVTADPLQMESALRDLLRVGVEDVAGYLQRGMVGWFEAGMPFVRAEQMSVQELKARAVDHPDGLQVVDVRRDDEWNEGAIPTATHMFLPTLEQKTGELDRSRPTVVYCASGYRASIGVSVLQRRGFRDVRTVPGSMAAWKAQGYPIEPEKR